MTSKTKGFIGLVLSICVSFIGVTYKENPQLALLTPFGILIAFFFVGYMFRGNWKDGVRWILVLTIISTLIFAIAWFLR